MSFSPNETTMWLHVPSAGLHILPSEDLNERQNMTVESKCLESSFLHLLIVSLQIPQLGPGCNLFYAKDKNYENSKYGSVPLYRHYRAAMSSVYEQYVFPAPC